MNPVYWLGWTLFRAVYRFYFGWRVFNAERVPITGPVVLACNHASFIDPPLVGAGLHREVNYLARENLFRFPVMGWVLRQWQSGPGLAPRAVPDSLVLSLTFFLRRMHRERQ